MHASWRGEQRVDTCDVVVVGAGIVGAAVAARLASAGKQVAVLDAQQIAGGATGRSAGMVIVGMPGTYQWAVQSFGREQARALWASTVEGRKWLVDAAIRLGIPLRQPGSLALAITEEEREALQASAELLQEDGFDVWFGTSDPLERGFLAALRQPNDAVVDAAELTRALLSTAPIAVHTGTEVYDLEPEGDMVRVWAQGRTVRCESAVLAVDGYVPFLHRGLGSWVAPGRALLAVTEALPEQVLPTPCYADYGYEYACPLPDGRLLVGAWRRPSSEVPAPEGEESLRGGLSRFIEQYFPQAQGRIVDRRSGVVGVTPDGLPILGRLDDVPQVVFAVGFGGWGLSWVFAAAERLVEWMLNDAELGLLSADRLL